MGKFLSFDEIKEQFPNQWILLGDPKMDGIVILGGIVVFAAPTKQGLLEGRDLLKPFAHSTWSFTGERQRGTGQWVSIFRQVPQNV
jgi:hypothetical protein